MTRISVVTAVRNARDTIEGCLESVAGQTCPAEHIVVDGASSDGTREALERHRGRIARLVSEPDRGIYDGMNKGIALATGDVVGTLNADDFYAHREVLQRVAEAFADPAVDACYGDLEYVDARDASRVVRRWRAGGYRPRKFFQGWMPPHPTFFVRRRHYRELGAYDESLGTAADYELMLRFLLRHRLRACYIPEVLVRMRSGGASGRSLAARLRANRMDKKAWEINGLRRMPWTIAFKPLRKLIQFIPRGETR